ncbi:MAG: UpxY family transcription antiterminator [Bacteroidia bacterium]|nr:UpxY family transcription antiterminator [Bacteroidia bacterium]
MNKWYLLYTAPRAEKKVNLELAKRNFTTFLPLQKKLVQWSDRKKMVETPLFSSYIFVYTSLSFYYELLNIAGIVKFVTFQGQPAELSESQINLIKLMVANYEDVEAVTETFEKGEQVKIIAGPLQNQIGELIEHKSLKKVMVKIENTGFSLVVQLPKNIIRKV